jgi:hypothetical protein
VIGKCLWRQMTDSEKLERDRLLARHWHRNSKLRAQQADLIRDTEAAIQLAREQVFAAQAQSSPEEIDASKYL